MKTMQPTLKNGRNVFDRINMPVSEFESRIQAVVQTIKQRQIDVLLVYGYDFDEYGNVAYLSNFLVDLTRGDLVAVTREGDVTLFFEGSPRGIPSARTTTFVEDLRACPDISKEVAPYLKEKGLFPATVGFAGLSRLMPQIQLGVLIESLGDCRVVEAEDIILGLREVKSFRECDQIRRSSRIIGGVFDHLAGSPLRQMNEKSLEAEIIREARMEGAEDVRVMFGAFQDGKPKFFTSDHQALATGQPLAVFVSLAFERYWAEGARTFLVKDHSLLPVESSRADGLFQELGACFVAGQEIGLCYRHALDVLERAGATEPQPYGLGQGLGLGPRESPILDRSEKRPLKHGMALSLRVLMESDRNGPLLIGRTVVLTESGPEILTV